MQQCLLQLWLWLDAKRIYLELESADALDVINYSQVITPLLNNNMKDNKEIIEEFEKTFPCLSEVKRFLLKALQAKDTQIKEIQRRHKADVEDYEEKMKEILDGVNNLESCDDINCKCCNSIYRQVSNII